MVTAIITHSTYHHNCHRIYSISPLISLINLQHVQMDNEFYGTVDGIIEHLKNVLLNSPDKLMQSDRPPTLQGEALFKIK